MSSRGELEPLGRDRRAGNVAAQTFQGGAVVGLQGDAGVDVEPAGTGVAPDRCRPASSPPQESRRGNAHPGARTLRDGAGGGGVAKKQENLVIRVALFLASARHRESAHFDLPGDPAPNPPRDASEIVFVRRRRGMEDQLAVLLPFRPRERESRSVRKSARFIAVFGNRAINSSFEALERRSARRGAASLLEMDEAALGRRALGRYAGDVEARGHGRAGRIASVPDERMIATPLDPIHQHAHDRSAQIVDHQAHRAGALEVESEFRPGIERVWMGATEKGRVGSRRR